MPINNVRAVTEVEFIEFKKLGLGNADKMQMSELFPLGLTEVETVILNSKEKVETV